ncbi:ANTAR domain-containing protein [Mycolicibacterium hippocampi]|uniref:ANTAR domain-containing protein n=1 Tax=Mycobacteriaceae TaxID=1762 RepID=UPI0015B49610|nr:ANTAR domain-containing protein [Mycolicibacterium hippocampi]
MSEKGLQGDQASRRVIDVAIGILIGVRGCTEREAFDELAGAVRQTGVGLGAIAGALVDLVAGAGGASPHRDQALDVWGHMLACRGTRTTGIAAV